MKLEYCERCGVKLNGYQRKYCRECARIVNLERGRIYKRSTRREERPDHSAGNPLSTATLNIHQCIRIIERYNERMGTHYSYGTFPLSFKEAVKILGE